MTDSPENLPARPAWEVDFPLERVEAQHVTRREFAKFLVLASGGLAVGSGWVAAKDASSPRGDPGPVRLAALSEIPVGGMTQFTIPGLDQPGILIRLEEGLFRAFEQKCTHLSCAVFFDPGSRKIECPCHNGAFDPLSGPSSRGPARPLRSFPVEVRGDEIWLVPPDAPGAAAPAASAAPFADSLESPAAPRPEGA
jgi:Ferredoxin subunits of nitrite reductase and ring-hydroxylating dioxygenases